MTRIVISGRSLKDLREALGMTHNSLLQNDLRKALTPNDLTRIIVGVLMTEQLHHGDIDGLAAAIAAEVWKYVRDEG